MERKPQALASCTNCWYNGMQNGSIGLSLGYCAEHKVVLRKSNETTCAKLMRKDLLFHSAQNFNHNHRRRYALETGVQRLTDCLEVTSPEYIDADTHFLRNDPVGELVSNYGEYDSKIESLAQLSTAGTMRSETAMISLARGYVDRCIKRKGTWKSGLHLFWWTRQKLALGIVPAISPSDIRYSTSGSLERQVELATWSLLIFRLAFISDIGVHAKLTAIEGEENVFELSDFAELAAMETETPNLRKLLRWIKIRGIPLLDASLPESQYRKIGAALKAQPD